MREQSVTGYEGQREEQRNGRVTVLRTPDALTAEARAHRGRVRVSEREARQFEGRSDVRLVVLAVDDLEAGWWLLLQ